MTEIIPTTIERIKKFKLFGADISIGHALYAFVYHSVYDGKAHRTVIEPVSFLFDHEETNAIITHRLILKRLKIEIKTVVQYNYSFA
jgi:hypothetical protein